MIISLYYNDHKHFDEITCSDNLIYFSYANFTKKIEFKCQTEL